MAMSSPEIPDSRNLVEVASDLIDLELTELYRHAGLLEVGSDDRIDITAEELMRWVRAAWAIAAHQALSEPDRIQEIITISMRRPIDPTAEGPSDSPDKQ